MSALKTAVHDFWNAASCGEIYATGPDFRHQLESQAAERYRLEPYLRPFAQFETAPGKDVLEIGVGMGADHLEWARNNPKSLTGIDLTERAIRFTASRLSLYNLTSDLRVADAENLPFSDASFDLVYSFGVLHHSPDTPHAIREVCRVLRPGGTARIMIYHARSVVGYVLWLRYALLAGRPSRTLRDIYAAHLESPGTKAYTVDEARAMLAGFSSTEIRIQLGFGDLMEGAVGQRHAGVLLTTAKRIWPRWLLKKLMRNHGLGMLITAVK